MGSESRFPFALRLAVQLLPREVREEVLGDLIEHWTLHVRSRGRLARLIWVWRQPLSTLAIGLRISRVPEGPQRIARRRGVGASASWLDVKLALRMLVKRPGLTLVALFVLAIGIPVGLLPIHVTNALTAPLPVENGEEIVIVRNYDV